MAPNVFAPAPVKGTSKILSKGFAAVNSVDIPVTTSNSTPSENSIFVSPNDPDAAKSNNSTPQPSTGTVYGADEFNTPDGGNTWSGTFQGAGGGNSETLRSLSVTATGGLSVSSIMQAAKV
ncbi:MAG: hypothetical protein IPH45_21060 [Bacteroidales bacterium]|nr:hypothetical protein [Bacteroidales bacterium]